MRDDGVPIRIRTRRKFPVWAIALIAAVALPVVAGVVGVTALFVIGFVSTGGTGSGKVWTEEELVPLVKGKRAAEVIQLLGQPRDTFKNPEKDGRAMFYYDGNLHNPYTNKSETFFVEFENGVATGKVR